MASNFEIFEDQQENASVVHEIKRERAVLAPLANKQITNENIHKVQVRKEKIILPL
jgi:hypothetical protein